MKKLIFVFVIILLASCSKDEGSSNCGSYNGHSLQVGEQGGCYYINSNGKKPT
jgi:hypothetical protein